MKIHLRPGNDPERDVVVQMKARNFSAAQIAQTAAYYRPSDSYRLVSTTISRRKSGSPVNLTMVFKKMNMQVPSRNKEEWMRFLEPLWGYANQAEEEPNQWTEQSSFNS